MGYFGGGLVADEKAVHGFYCEEGVEVVVGHEFLALVIWETLLWVKSIFPETFDYFYFIQV
jgi:hypothetical protein